MPASTPEPSQNQSSSDTPHDTHRSDKNQSSSRLPVKGAIGEISGQIGHDLRELVMAGYSHHQITPVIQGRKTLAELFAETPDNPPQG